MKTKDILTFYDKILMIFIIILSIILILGSFYYEESDSEEELTLMIQQGDEIVKKIAVADSYQQPITVEVEGPIGIHKIELDQGRVRVSEAPADDPLKLCERTGWIDSEGPIIVCVPNNLSIWLESTNSDIDGMSW